MNSNYKHVDCEVKIKRSEEFRKIGKEFFASKKYHQALEKFEGGFKCLNPSALDEKEDLDKLKKQEVIFLMNICACKFKLKEFRIVVEISKKIQEMKNYIDNKNMIMKNFYRKGMAELEINDYDNSVMSLFYALELNKNSTIIQRNLNRAIEANDRYLKREKKVYKDLFKK